MIPAGLEEALDRFETLIAIRRGYDREVSLQAFAAFALAADIDGDGLAHLSFRIEDIIESGYYKRLGSGILLGIVIGCLGRVEADLARRDS